MRCRPDKVMGWQTRLPCVGPNRRPIPNRHQHPNFHRRSWGGCAHSQALTPTSTPKGAEAAKENHAKDDTAYKIQEATKRYSVDMIAAAMDTQYTTQLDKEYVGFTNETIKRRWNTSGRSGASSQPPNAPRPLQNSANSGS